MSRIIDETELRAARWFAGKDRAIESVAESDAVAVPGGRLVLLDVRYAGGAQDRYLLPDAGGREPAPGEGFWSALLQALRAGPLGGRRGQLVLRAAPALEALAGGAGEARPSTDQSNTLVVVGDTLLVKAYRRLQAGVHPEVELAAALAGTDAPVPAHGGSIHHVGADGADTAVALLQEFVPAATSGWEPPIDRAAALLREGADPAADAAAHGRLGAATAALHVSLERALGSVAGDTRVGGRWLGRAEAALAEVAGDPALVGRHASPTAIAARLAPLRRGAPSLSRVHGDLHVAQFLHAGDRLLVVDLEGDPTLPLAVRREPDTPLRDVAGLLRSLDHVGSAAARRSGADPSAWIASATEAALAGYAAVAREPPDRALLDALELAKELQEMVYARRVLPEWAYTARAGLQRLLARPLPQER